MTPPASAPILVFDVNETLLDITTLEPVFETVFGDPDMLREWFAQLVLYSQTLTLSGIYTSFGEIGVGALKMVAAYRDRDLSKADIDALKDRMSKMPAHPDVEPALTRLRDAGFRMVTLTNSPPGPSPTPLERAGLAGFFERGFSVDAVQRFKPAPETYAHVADELGVERSDLCLVACHLWDTIGAQAAGCMGAFVTRPLNAFLPATAVPEPDFTAPDMNALAEQFLEKWA